MLSKHVEHNRWPFLFQNVFVDLSISFLQIKHLNIGTIKLYRDKVCFYNNIFNNYFLIYWLKLIKIFIKKDLSKTGLFSV